MDYAKMTTPELEELIIKDFLGYALPEETYMAILEELARRRHPEGFAGDPWDDFMDHLEVDRK